MSSDLAHGTFDSRTSSGFSGGIVTAEAVVLDLETAGVASRVIAGGIDLLVQLAILIIGALLLGIVLRNGFNSDSQSTFTTAMAMLLALVIMVYPVVVEMVMRGRSIGKRAMGLRAVTLEGSPIRLRHALLRMMGGLVDRYLPPLGITGALFVLGTSRGQRVGDLMAGTIVVRDPDRAPLPAALWFPIPRGLEQFAATIDPTAMSAEQYSVVRTFLLRVNELSPVSRFLVAQDLAGRVAVTLNHAGPGHIDPESYLVCVLARRQRAASPGR